MIVSGVASAVSILRIGPVALAIISRAVRSLLFVVAHEREAQAPVRPRGWPLTELTGEPTGCAWPGDVRFGLSHDSARFAALIEKHWVTALDRMNAAHNRGSDHAKREARVSRSRMA